MQAVCHRVLSCEVKSFVMLIIDMYVRCMKKILIVFVFLLSCAYPKRTTDYEAAVLSSGKALVYIYRTPTQIDSLNPDWPKLYMNGDVVGKLGVGGYYVQAVEPGEVTVSYKNGYFGFYPWTADEIKLTAVPNQKYFINYSIESIMRFVNFKLVPATFGESDVKSTHLLINE